MKLFLPILIIFILIFGLTTNKSFAADTNNPANIETFSLIETQGLKDTIVDWWNSVFHWSITFRNYFAKKYQIDLSRNKVVTSYSSDKKITADLSTRAISEENRDKMKMDYLKGVLVGNYDGTVELEKCGNNTKFVTIWDLADYIINNNAPTNGEPACYDKIYMESYTVPQGEKQKDLGTEENSQNININKIVRTPIPDAAQGPTPNPDTKRNQIDTAKHTNKLYRNILPDNFQPTKDNQLPQSFGQWLHPQNEQ